MQEQVVLKYAQEHIAAFNAKEIVTLPQAGSDRIYYRLSNEREHIIATYSNNIEENKRFIALSQYFSNAGISVPEILSVNTENSLYFQTDGGSVSLLEKVQADGHTEEIKAIYKQVLFDLFDIQACARKQSFNSLFEACNSFGIEQVLFDLNYFKNNFLSKANISFDEQKLNEEFDRWSKDIGSKEQRFFMYRDCQGRNIMLQGDKHTFIDFQGGLKGHPLYDVVSLLWQAKAKIPAAWKAELVQAYLQNVSHQLTSEDMLQMDVEGWESDYHKLTLTRLLQVLGAYGLRGLVEGKEHFISSIPLGLENIKEWLAQNSLSAYPTLQKILEEITTTKFIEQWKIKN